MMMTMRGNIIRLTGDETPYMRSSSMLLGVASDTMHTSNEDTDGPVRGDMVGNSNHACKWAES